MKEDFLIRECTLKDLAEIKVLSETTFVESFGEDNNEEDLRAYLLENFSSEKLEKELKDEHSRYYIVLSHEEPVGYMKVNFEEGHTEKGYGNSLEVQRIYVLKKCKGQGIGKRLMETAQKIGKENGLDYIWLGVWEKNTSAIGFYEKLGFRKIGSHVFVIGEDEQVDYLMKLEL